MSLGFFVDALDDKVGPTSPTPPSVVEDGAHTLLMPIALPPHSRSDASVEIILVAGGARQEMSKVMSV